MDKIKRARLEKAIEEIGTINTIELLKNKLQLKDFEKFIFLVLSNFDYLQDEILNNIKK